jgi:hypothetical protein
VRPVEVARQQPPDRAGATADIFQIRFGRTRKVIVDDDRRDGGDEPDRGRQQCFGNARRDYREIRGLRFGNADEAVHDSPDGAEQRSRIPHTRTC